MKVLLPRCNGEGDSDLAVDVASDVGMLVVEKDGMADCGGVLRVVGT